MRIIAHRGGAAHAPENTFAAFDFAVASHAHGMETDIRLTGDQIPVLIHDPTLDRTTDGTGRVCDLTFDQLQQFDAAADSPARNGPERVPSLEAFLERYARSGKTLHLEFKELAAVEPALDILRKQRAADHAELELISFKLEIIAAMRERMPGAVVGWLLSEPLSEQTIDRALELGLEQIRPHITRCEPASLQRARDAGLSVRIWGVKELAHLQTAVAYGVDTITLDNLDWWADGAIAPHLLNNAERLTPD